MEICSAYIITEDPKNQTVPVKFPHCAQKSFPAQTTKDIELYSYIDAGLVPTADDRLISFSTCYEEDDQRYVVIGILRELERLPG